MPPIIQSRHEHLTRVLSPFLSAAPALGSRPGHSRRLSPTGEQPPTGAEAVIVNQSGTNPNNGLLPLLLNQREILKRIRMNKNLLYRSMQAGSFPFPVEVRQRTVRWTSTSLNTHLESSQQTGYTFNGTSAMPLAGYKEGMGC